MSRIRNTDAAAILAAAILADAVVDALMPSRRQVVDFVLTFVIPWLVGMAWLSAYAVRFVYRVWGWMT